MNDDQKQRPDDETDAHPADPTSEPSPQADEASESASASDAASTEDGSHPEASDQARSYETGDVLTGKVVNIKPYGAFVELPDGETGLVHISEVDEAYVKDVHEYLSTGQEVAVKVVGVHDSGKYNLSIRQLSDRERDSAFYSREMREFSRELEMRRDEIQREARWRQATLKEPDEEERISHAEERAELEAWLEKARDFADATRQRSEDRARSYPIL